MFEALPVSVNGTSVAATILIALGGLSMIIAGLLNDGGKWYESVSSEAEIVYLFGEKFIVAGYIVASIHIAPHVFPTLFEQIMTVMAVILLFAASDKAQTAVTLITTLIIAVPLTIIEYAVKGILLVVSFITTNASENGNTENAKVE